MTHGNLVAEWYPYRPLGVREKRKKYGSDSDKSGSVDQIEAREGCEGHRHQCGAPSSEPELTVEHKMVSLRITAHGIGITKVPNRSTG